MLSFYIVRDDGIEGEQEFLDKEGYFDWDPFLFRELDDVRIAIVDAAAREEATPAKYMSDYKLRVVELAEVQVSVPSLFPEAPSSNIVPSLENAVAIGFKLSL
ncbi:MAG: hypothetical protein JW384_03862 [Nitrosomonadaceae bacterium]|nr:hypothetical protein [Nitrosomonadaceae bacterium]